MSERLKLKNRALLALARALDSLDGVNMDGMVEPFEFDPKVQWNLSKNAVLVARAKEAVDYSLAKLKTIHQIIQGESITEANRERFVAFQQAVEDQLELESEVDGILFVTLDELRKRPDRANRKPGTNLMAVSVLKNLNPIIREDVDR